MKHVSLWAILKLRVQLWWMFGFDQWKKPNVGHGGVIGHHRLKIRWNGRFRTWMWICLVESEVFRPGEAPVKNIGEYNLGTLHQWTLQEALNLAARKAAWVIHPDQEPVKEPEPNQEKPKHGRMYRLLDGGMIAVECICGWIAPTFKCHPEQDSATRCQACAFAEEAYKQHESGAALNLWEAAVDRGPRIEHWTTRPKPFVQQENPTAK